MRFATLLAQKRGHICDADLEAVRAAGFSDAGVVEIMGQVAEGFFTNLLNTAAQTDVDFPAMLPAS